MSSEIDYKSWTIQQFMDECYRLNIKAQSFVFRLSKTKEKRLLEQGTISSLTHANPQDPECQNQNEEKDEDLDDGTEGLSLGPFQSLLSTKPPSDLDPNAYPTIPDFPNYTIPALIAEYKDRKLQIHPSQCTFSRPLLVKSLIQDEFTKIEKRFHRQMFRAPVDVEDVERRKEIVKRHFELEERCLNVLSECDGEIWKEKVAIWEGLKGEVEAKREQWLTRVEDQRGAGSVEGYAGLGFVEHWFT